MKKLFCILLVLTLALAVPTVVGADSVTVSYTIGDEGYELSIPASVSPSMEGTSQTIAVSSNHSGTDIIVKLESSEMGGSGTTGNPFMMCRNKDKADFDLKYSITDVTSAENVEIGSTWKFNGNGSGNQSYELLYKIISDVNYKPKGTYTDILTFTVS